MDCNFKMSNILTKVGLSDVSESDEAKFEEQKRTINIGKRIFNLFRNFIFISNF